MSYTAECVICGQSGSVPNKDERITSGTKLFRTQSEEYKQVAQTANFAETEEEREKAKKRLEYISQWDHYCQEHAAGIGIAPEPMDVHYRCEECGEINEHHKAIPVGHGNAAACVDCGATAIVREQVEQ